MNHFEVILENQFQKIIVNLNNILKLIEFYKISIYIFKEVCLL